MGTTQVIEDMDNRALSTDGVSWQIQTRHQMPNPGWGSLENIILTRRFIRYGLWSKQTGLNRLPLPPNLDIKNICNKAETFLHRITNLISEAPFPGRDHIELWLLDRDNNLPVALIASVVEANQAARNRDTQWCLGSQEIYLQVPAAARQDKTGTSAKPSKEQLLALIQKTTGHPARAQWFRRDNSGAGIGLHGMRIDIKLAGRILEYGQFPSLPLREHWPDENARRLVKAFHDWQAPYLLTLTNLDDVTRENLEQAACSNALAVDDMHRLYPKIIHHDLINKALVEARLRKTNPQ